MHIGVVDFMDSGGGNEIKVGDMDHFRFSLSSYGHDTAEEVSDNSIRKSRVIFTPGAKFKQMINNLKFKKLSYGE